jgi:hypothetical protein
MDAEDRLQITPLAFLFHRPLTLQQTGMLKKHHGKATQYRVLEGIAELLTGTRIGHGTERGR